MGLIPTSSVCMGPSVKNTQTRFTPSFLLPISLPTSTSFLDPGTNISFLRRAYMRHLLPTSLLFNAVYILYNLYEWYWLTDNPRPKVKYQIKQNILDFNDRQNTPFYSLIERERRCVSILASGDGFAPGVWNSSYCKMGACVKYYVWACLWLPP